MGTPPAPETARKELAAERLDRVREIARQRQIVRVEELGALLGVSAATVRRDLEFLEARGELRRVHGGAVSAESRTEEPLFDDKTGMAPREKHRIAAEALQLVEPGGRIYLDGGSTVLQLARLLRERTNLTVVTNSLRAALELSGRGPRLILIGGELRRLSQTMVGALSRHVLGELHVDQAFMGTIGLDLAGGLTTTDPEEAYTKELVTRQAREVIVLADRSKLGKISFARSGGLERVHVLITDAVPDAGWRRELRRRKIRLIEAG